MGGSFSGPQGFDKGGEVWDPTTNVWKNLTNLPSTPMLSDDPQGVFRTDNYGFFFAWTNNTGRFLITNFFISSFEFHGVCTSCAIQGKAMVLQFRSLP